jgi:hypothetical protein
MRVSVSLWSLHPGHPGSGDCPLSIEVAEPVLDPLNHIRQAGENMDEAQDDDPVTHSDPDSVKIVQNRVIGLDQAAGDQDQPHG